MEKFTIRFFEIFGLVIFIIAFLSVGVVTIAYYQTVLDGVIGTVAIVLTIILVIVLTKKIKEK